ncbi:hypothetical protein NEIELOOT_02061 [Neisseria elongata subsp. glycolytica ATCC 29315]|uniref:Uncharacterized protein n=1 Tax=Neisseria elongata subsp. glycolytica ATCC 29315 TaxID=546263 RepID=D4DSL6_NEIEG|nr:hypothetical protein NEIELOOT_02061 [Neisseria elongata subsp. glycolytica ATCC 29315]
MSKCRLRAECCSTLLRLAGLMPIARCRMSGLGGVYAGWSF